MTSISEGQESTFFGNISALYGSNLDSLGAHVTALGWKSVEEQNLRFDKLTGCIPKGRSISIIDYGCGFADLVPYILKSGQFHLSNYQGSEINPAIRKIAAERFSRWNVNGEIVDSKSGFMSSNWAIVSGTFNVKLDVAHDRWENNVKDRLRILFSLVDEGLSFNSLSSYVDWQEGALFYANPLTFFDFCKRELSSKVHLAHDYPLYEWTITVTK